MPLEQAVEEKFPGLYKLLHSHDVVEGPRAFHPKAQAAMEDRVGQYLRRHHARVAHWALVTRFEKIRAASVSDRSPTHQQPRLAFGAGPISYFGQRRDAVAKMAAYLPDSLYETSIGRHEGNFHCNGDG